MKIKSVALLLAALQLVFILAAGKCAGPSHPPRYEDRHCLGSGHGLDGSNRAEK